MNTFVVILCFAFMAWVVAGLILKTKSPVRDIIKRIRKPKPAVKVDIGRFEGLFPAGDDHEDSDHGTPPTEAGRLWKPPPQGPPS